MADKKNGDAAAPPHTPEGKGTAPKNKMEAVKLAIQALGLNAPRGELQKYILNKFNMEMTADHISNYKGEIKRRSKGKGRKKAGKAKAPKAAPATPPAARPAPAPAPVPAPAVVKADSVSLKAIQAAKGLLGLVAPEQAKALIDVLAR
jgi:hypothetical protein